MKKVLILCKGNACRSQMAEAYLKFYTQEKVEVYSVGLEAKGLHLLTQKVMAEDGLNISTHNSEPAKQWKGIQFDYLISVCGTLDTPILELFPDTHYTAWDFPDPDAVTGTESTRLQTFRTVREAIKAQIIRFIGEEPALHLELRMEVR